MTRGRTPLRPTDGPDMTERRRQWALLAVAGVVAISLLGACTAGDDLRSDPGDMPSGHMTESPGQHMGDAGSMMGGIARPIDAQDAARVVAVEALDELAFDPSVIDVAVGDTIAFEVTNTGAATHEFMLAPTAMQDQHGEEMAGSGHMMTDAAHAVSLTPGETKTVAMRFVGEGTLEYGCHVPGHYEGGMVGTVVARNL